VNARQGRVVATLAAIGLWSLQALAQGPPQAGAAPKPAAKPAVATVGPRRITREEWDRRSDAAAAEFSRRNANAELPPEMRDLIRRQVLEGMIRFEMLALEAKRTGVTASPLEAEEILKKDAFFNPGGRFDEQRFLAVKTTQTAAFNAAIQQLQDQLAARELNSRLEARYRPDDATLRASAVRSLSRASVDHVTLRRADFAGTYPEPRERDVLAWYAAHQADYLRPDRATLTVTFVNSPGLSDSIRALPGGAEAWSTRMKALADSILAEVARGATLEKAAGFLGPRSNTVVTSDNFPGYWRASDAQNKALFEPKNVGKVIPQALPSVEGWLVVRVDELIPAHVAPLREVAREIRGILRKDMRLHHEEYEQRAFYAQIRDSLAAPGWKFRWALADTGAQRIAAPTDADLDRWYRGHLADYSGFDPKAGTIVSKPLSEVREEVRARWLAERRRAESRQQADALFKAWSAGRRDAALETAMKARETPALVQGAIVDSTDVGKALSDTLWSYADPRGPGLVPTPRGWVVWMVSGRVDRAVPSFEQAREIVARRLEVAKLVADEAGGQRLWEADPAQFGGGNVVHFSRFAIPEPAVLNVKLTRAEVERYHRENLSKYSAPELVTAKHILVSPANNTPEADRAARQRAEDVLRRAKAGEDFTRLARDYSDDEATKDKGGELGTFGRGTMVDAFERVVFALPSAEFAPAPVKTPLGYHVVYCQEHVPATIHPLEWVYTMVGADAAAAKAERLTQARADSILRVCRTPAAARALAGRMGLAVHGYTKKVGEAAPSTLTRDYYDQLDRAKPGQLLPSSYHLKSQGFWVSWVDSVTSPSLPTWEEARPKAVEAYQRGAGLRALEAKRTELDSLFAAGWSLDSVGALWGGPERVVETASGRGIPGMGGAEILDSLVIGGAKPPVLAPGQASGWIDFPNGISRIRLAERQEPTADQVSVRVENDRAAAIERGLSGYYADLRKRYPVSILDAKMREMSVATPAPPPGRQP
jgi:hypothetical protein